jgi:hypothetical protein
MRSYQGAQWEETGDSATEGGRAEPSKLGSARARLRVRAPRWGLRLHALRRGVGVPGGRG